MSESAKANRINVKEPVYCLVQSDGPEGTTYGDVKSLGDAMQIQLTPGLSTGTLYGNGVKKEDIAFLNSISVALDVNKLKIETRADILGHQYQSGVLIEEAGDEAPYIAVGYKVEQTNDKEELIWLLKGRAQPVNDSVQQMTENINFSTNTISINFIPRESDKLLRFFADTANPDFTEEQASVWFEKGPSKPPVPSKKGKENQEVQEAGIE